MLKSEKKAPVAKAEVNAIDEILGRKERRSFPEGITGRLHVYIDWFIQDWCLVDKGMPAMKERAEDLYASFCEYASGVWVVPEACIPAKQLFAKHLQQRFEKSKEASGYYHYHGISILPKCRAENEAGTPDEDRLCTSPIQHWLEEWCIVDKDNLSYKELSVDLYASFCAFCTLDLRVPKGPQECVISQKRFGEQLQQQFKKYKCRKVYYLGIKIIPGGRPGDSQWACDGEAASGKMDPFEEEMNAFYAKAQAMIAQMVTSPRGIVLR